MASDTATATPERTERATPTALTEAPRSSPISTTSGASTTIEACVAVVASTSGSRRRAREGMPQGSHAAAAGTVRP